jgi:hypothetical protein
MTLGPIQPPPPRMAPILGPAPTIRQGPTTTQGSLSSRATGSGPNRTTDLSGHVFSQVWSGWFRRLTASLNTNFAALAPPPVSFTGTITTAKLTVGGANGSMTFANGILISEVAAT